MGEMDNVIKEFLIESYENLDQLDRDLVTLEQEPDNTNTLASIFRTIHTIKGTCGFFGFSRLEKVTHVGESLLSLLRDQELKLSAERTSGLLAMVDAVRAMLSRIEETGEEGEGDYSALVERLSRLQEEDERSARTSEATFLSDGPSQPQPAVEAPRDKQPQRLGEMFVEAGRLTPTEVQQALERQASGDPRHVGEILIEQGSLKPEDVVQALQTQQQVQNQGLSEGNIRVDVGLLDKLMNLVGELVLARNQILQYSTTQEDTAFLSTSQRLNLITTELQEGVMKTRMQPIGNIWSKFPRIVRDLSVTCGKQVRIEMEGKETDLDRTIIEAIKDPLTHVVRNSVDHGIETPSERVAAGKDPEGTLYLRAFHEGGQVNIEISDDGRGMDPVRIKDKALERGMITRDQAARLTDREAIQIIFRAGFSMAEKVTNISGRGVGMDVVRSNIEKIGGTVDLNSRTGYGTSLKIKIPLTLAIIPALVITTAGDRYAIPQVNLLELVRLEGEQARQGIEMIHGTPVYRLRGNLLPLAYLNRELKIVLQEGALELSEEGEPTTRNLSELAAQQLLNAADLQKARARRAEQKASRTTCASADDQLDAVNIVVLQADDRQFGLVVDEINDTEEIVVKPLSKQLKGIPMFAGATIMGDGRVALILDVLGIAQGAGMAASGRDRALSEQRSITVRAVGDVQTLLVFQVGQHGRMAIPLSMVARLEEFPRSTIERAGTHDVVQYRERILPLLRLSEQFEGYGSSGDEDLTAPLQVVVYNQGERSIGLQVDRILDIVEDQVQVEPNFDEEGIRGSAVIQGRVTDLLDVTAVINRVDPEFFTVHERALAEVGA